ncbi:hypothetical protein [Nocardioides sp. zg-1230]|uniref:hypothetical protein n=1 Tax=Nocardioides sp. zg-1230 TaxID=2736601 RepID=UPI0015579C62|nr:hypothetical protein [Nocardioides sp. zg-1230]NPC45048.1 hypothetical protein [Nocardioides sp. zg-1230]
MIPLHMGALHPFEQALTLLLAFGPFVVLGVVIWRRRREEDDSAVPDEDHVSSDATSPVVDPERREPLS